MLFLTKTFRKIASGLIEARTDKQEKAPIIMSRISQLIECKTGISAGLSLTGEAAARESMRGRHRRL